MASMLSLGVQPSESLVLMEYEEVGRFITQVQKQVKNKELTNLLTMNESHIMALMGTNGTKGAHKLNVWRDNIRAKLLGEDVQKETLFTRMKKKYLKSSSKSNLRKLREL